MWCCGPCLAKQRTIVISPILRLRSSHHMAIDLVGEIIILLLSLHMEMSYQLATPSKNKSVFCWVQLLIYLLLDLRRPIQGGLLLSTKKVQKKQGRVYSNRASLLSYLCMATLFGRCLAATREAEGLACMENAGMPACRQIEFNLKSISKAFMYYASKHSSTSYPFVYLYTFILSLIKLIEEVRSYNSIHNFRFLCFLLCVQFHTLQIKQKDSYEENMFYVSICLFKADRSRYLLIILASTTTTFKKQRRNESMTSLVSLSHYT